MKAKLLEFATNAQNEFIRARTEAFAALERSTRVHAIDWIDGIFPGMRAELEPTQSQTTKQVYRWGDWGIDMFGRQWPDLDHRDRPYRIWFYGSQFALPNGTLYVYASLADSYVCNDIARVRAMLPDEIHVVEQDLAWKPRYSFALAPIVVCQPDKKTLHNARNRFELATYLAPLL